MRSDLKKVSDSLKYFRGATWRVKLDADRLADSIAAIVTFAEDCLNEKEKEHEKISIQTRLDSLEKDVYYLALKLEGKK